MNDYKKTKLYKFWTVLSKIEFFINHIILDEIFDHLPMENKKGDDTIFFKIYMSTVYKTCYFVTVSLYEKLFYQEKER